MLNIIEKLRREFIFRDPLCCDISCLKFLKENDKKKIIIMLIARQLLFTYYDPVFHVELTLNTQLAQIPNQLSLSLGMGRLIVIHRCVRRAFGHPWISVPEGILETIPCGCQGLAVSVSQFNPHSHLGGKGSCLMFHG